MFSIAFDRIDVTPEGKGLIGFFAPEERVPMRDPLFARLFLLHDDNGDCLVISLDYGGLYCSAHDEWRKELARVMDIPEERVILHCLHQHDAPFINIEAVAELGKELDWKWFDLVRENVKKSALALKNKLQSVKSVGWSERRVQGYASNRRVLMEDGSTATRYSRCPDPQIREKPTGVIDPFLRTLAFFGPQDELLAAWSFYATHPQVANEGRRFSADAPGEAMKLLAERYPGVMNSLFNGCFGNLTAGKYTSCDDLERNVRHFGKLLADAVDLNLQAMEKVEVEKFTWTREVFDFPVRYLSEDEMAERYRYHETVGAALSAGEKYGKTHGEKYAVELLSLGDVRILFLNGELFVEYQLFAQSLIPDRKLAVVGNCGDTFYYIGTAEALSNPEGYEVKSYCRVLPEFEGLFRETVRKLLLK